MHKSRSHLTHDTHQELYDALTWSMLLDEATTKEGDKPNKVPTKRDRKDDQDEDPSAGSNQEELVECLVFEKASDDVEQTFDDNMDNVSQPPHTDADETKAYADPKILKKPWFNDMVQAENPPLTFDEMMITPINFFAYAINPLKLNKITKEVLVGPVFNLLKDKEGRLTILDEFFFNNDLEYLKSGNKERTAMIKRKSKHEVFSTMMILSVVSVQVEKKYGYGNLEEIVVRRADQKLYKFKKGDFSDLHLNDIEYMLLLIAQNKLFNLEGDVIMDFVTALKMFTRGIIIKNEIEDVQLGVESYQRKLNLTKPQRTCQHISVKEPHTPNYDPSGIIYKDKSKKKRLMRVDDINKFCDGTLQSVCNILRERLLNFKFGYNKGSRNGWMRYEDGGESLENVVQSGGGDVVLRSVWILDTAITKAGTKLLLYRAYFSCSWDTSGISTLKSHYDHDTFGENTNHEKFNFDDLQIGCNLLHDVHTSECHRSCSKSGYMRYEDGGESLENVVKSGGLKGCLDHCNDGNPSRANIKQALRSNAYAVNPVKEILLKLNLHDQRSVLTEPEVHAKMEIGIPRSSKVKFITACSYSIDKYKIR
nr:hypothetical protein [Tanacetum cinerariifolium]